jgi:hypothetical protein
VRTGGRSTLAALAGALALWGGGSDIAHAGFSRAEADTSVRVAWDYWHSFKRPGLLDLLNGDCRPGRVTLDWRLDLGDAMASASLEGCLELAPTIKLERPTIRTLSDRHGCAVITHEFGHLLGYGHVRDQRSLMSGASSGGRTPPAGATWERAWNRCERRL